MTLITMVAFVTICGLIFILLGCYRSYTTECERLKEALSKYGVLCDPAGQVALHENATCISDRELKEDGIVESISECADFVESMAPGCEKYEVEELQEFMRKQRESRIRWTEFGRFPEGCHCLIYIDDRRFACVNAVRVGEE
jgi:hypothetical protein